jgi:phospholipase C
MAFRNLAAKTGSALRAGFCSLALIQLSFGATLAHAAENRSGDTRTPIKHVIVIIGENRSFDHVFATYVPKKGETVHNLLSEGIVALDANKKAIPGPNFGKAHQFAASDTDTFLLSPPKQEFPKSQLPAPLVGGPTGANGYFSGDNPCGTSPPISALECAQQTESGLADLSYYQDLVSGGTGQKKYTPDERITNVNTLPAGPFQLTNGGTFTYDAYAASPVHRFYQMWQQRNCTAAAGCQNTLFPWVEATVATGSNGKPPPAGFTYAEGATSMGFYNVQQGDVPYLKMLADTYSMSDNYHQAVNGGTGANHIMLGTGDAIWFSDGNGNPLTPPHNMMVASGSKNAGVVDEVENPNPLKGTNNWYTEDGYGGGSYGSPSYGGGSYTACADVGQPGVAAIVDYLKAVKVKPNCQAGHYYLLNNYNPGYYGDGTSAYADIRNPLNTVFTVPPSNVSNIGDALLKKNITFAYFGDQYNAYLANPYNNYVTPDNQYCNICNFFQYSTSIMTHPAVRNMALQDTLDLYADLTSGNLPAVSFVKPSGYLDGHPASSKIDLLEGFVKKIVDMIKANKTLWANTAIFITMDEGGGYYDSGYVQPLDYFGDGTRIPMVVVSKYSKGGNISHTYTDHVSVLKFIEANWNVPPITKRSRDNLPNPVAGANPYKPANIPAIGNLMDLFNFSS